MLLIGVTLSAGTKSKFKIIFLSDGSLVSKQIATACAKSLIKFKIVEVSYNFKRRKENQSFSNYLFELIITFLKSIRFFRYIFISKKNIYPYKRIYAGRCNSKKMKIILKNFKPDYIFISCGSILSHEIIQIPKYGIINIHPGVLPFARGLDVIYHSIINNYPIGVTAHFLSTGIDTGEIIDIKLAEIKKFDSLNNIKLKVNRIRVTLFVDLMAKLKSGNKILSEPQKNKFKLFSKANKQEITLAEKMVKNGKVYKNYLEHVNEY